VFIRVQDVPSQPTDLHERTTCAAQRSVCGIIDASRATWPAGDVDLASTDLNAAARRLSLGRTTLYALLKTGAITSVKVGRLRRIPAESLTEYTARLITEQRVS
jgi:excisionase family DNA binding protein